MLGKQDQSERIVLHLLRLHRLHTGNGRSRKRIPGTDEGTGDLGGNEHHLTPHPNDPEPVMSGGATGGAAGGDPPPSNPRGQNPSGLFCQSARLREGNGRGGPSSPSRCRASGGPNRHKVGGRGSQSNSPRPTSTSHAGVRPIHLSSSGLPDHQQGAKVGRSTPETSAQNSG